MPHNFQIDKCPLCGKDLISMWRHSINEDKFLYSCDIMAHDFNHYSVKLFGGLIEQIIIIENYMAYTTYKIHKEDEYESSISILETDSAGKQNWKDISNSNKNLFKTKEKLIKTILDLKLFI